jgi:glycerate kinase
VACDVDNPFSGKSGAAFVFAPQKGADPQMVESLDRGLKHMAAVIKDQLGKDIDRIPGAGAAGGMGGGLLAFLDARLTPGIRLVLDTLRFDDLLEGASLVITGEGRMDAQTAMGKAPQGIAEAAARKGIPVIALTGNVEDAGAVNRIGICAVFSIIPHPMTLQDAMKPDIARANIRQTVQQLFRWRQTFQQQPTHSERIHP